MSPKRPVGINLVGVLHAAGLLLVALDHGYAIGPSDYTVGGAVWRYGGLVVVAALPVWLAAQYRLFAPFVAHTLTTGYVLGVELTPPGPTFRDVADLEHLAEPTGITVVENGLYVVRYMSNASVWAVGFSSSGSSNTRFGPVGSGWPRRRRPSRGCRSPPRGGEHPSSLPPAASCTPP